MDSHVFLLNYDADLLRQCAFTHHLPIHPPIQSVTITFTNLSSIYPSFQTSVYPSLYPFTYPSIHLFVHLFILLFISTHHLTHLYTDPMHPYIYPSIHPRIHQSICSPIKTIHPRTYLYVLSLAHSRFTHLVYLSTDLLLTHPFTQPLVSHPPTEPSTHLSTRVLPMPHLCPLTHLQSLHLPDYLF